jgi:hypothetical protein
MGVTHRTRRRGAFERRDGSYESDHVPVVVDLDLALLEGDLVRSEIDRVGHA